MNPSLLDPAVAVFVIIPIALVVYLTAATAAASRRIGLPRPVARRRAWNVGASAVAWMIVTWIAAARGVLQQWDRTPPPFAVMIAGVVAFALALAFGSTGRTLAAGLPLWIHVGVQGFRLPLELAMHAMSERGVMPPQMTYTGRNFDIVTGAAAIAVAALVASGHGGRKLVAAWNVMGLGLLVNVVIVAILGTPVFRYFGERDLNTWVTYPPFVWLPAMMVLAALAGHLIIFRALGSKSVNQS